MRYRILQWHHEVSLPQHSFLVALCLQTAVNHLSTRKLCYRKDDRAMCPIYRCPENFGSPWVCPRPLVSKSLNGLLLGLSLRMFRPNLKFIALSVPDLIGDTPKIGQSLDTPRPFCLQIFCGFLLAVSLRMFRPNLKFIALSVAEIIGSTA